jgi:aerobic carbon-monoxide dehydrogenase medium subunit
MYACEYERPTSMADAANAIANGGQALAGGQTLIATMKQRLAAPGTLVDLSQIADLQGIRMDGDKLVIGAMVCHADVAESAVVQQAIPALAALAGGIGDRQVRARGTIGGSVANNDPSACYPCALLGLGATVITDKRSIAADDFFQGMYATALEPGELIVAVSFPKPLAAVYSKFKQQASRFALVGVFLAKTASGVRVAVTGAGSSGVFRSTPLEAALNADFSAASAAKAQIPADDLNSDIHGTAAYRAHIIGVMAQRAVAQV